MNALVARPGEKSDVVESIQRKLQGLGFYDGPCDQVFGQALREAITQFQEARGLHQSGACDRDTWKVLADEAGWTFPDVLKYELDALAPDSSADTAGAQQSPQPQRCADIMDKAQRAGLAGLAFSGGGVRSATFNLGIVQALADSKLLGSFHYLSTVSGGGYIGGWLSRWIALTKDGAAGVEDEIAQRKPGTATKCEPRQIKFLRQYSNYLTPKTGFFSADTWAFLTSYFRNTLLNFLVLGFGLAAVLILPRIWVALVANYHQTGHSYFGAVGALAFLWSVFLIAFHVALVPNSGAKSVQGQGWVIMGIVAPLLVAAACGSVYLWKVHDVLSEAWATLLDVRFDPGAIPLATLLLAPGLVYFLVWASGWGLAQAVNRRARALNPMPVQRKAPGIWSQGWGHLWCAVGAFAVGAALIVTAAAYLDVVVAHQLAALHFSHLASFGAPFMLIIFGLTMVLMVGLVGRRFSDKTREWFSRQGGWTLIFMLAWISLFLFSIYSPALVVWLIEYSLVLGSGVLAGWLGTVVAGLWAAKNSATGAPGSSRWLEVLALCGPPLAAVAILTMLSTAIHFALTSFPHTPGAGTFSTILDGQLSDTENASWLRLGVGLLVCILACGVLAHYIDVNKFSLYTMYRNRLVRTYLGAVNPGRAPHPFTGFDVHDDVPLHRLMERSGKPGMPEKPYLIVNAALNLVRGKELAWQTRKAANFVFTPGFCGYETPSMPATSTAQAADESARGLFRRTESYGIDTTEADETEHGVRLGMAMAISGAAASPNMGYHSSPALTFLMTLFNVRLGRWFGNPASKHGWKKASPPAGLFYLVRELFGLTNASSDFLYLSDGGHFDNLGIYELVRRRCHLIVAVDASGDEKLNFGDLGNAVRKCGTDFNIEINIDVRNIELAQGSSFSRAYCVMGKIRYGAVHEGAQDGILLYIKPALLGTEYADILNYHKTNPNFPHQGTADQWFDETQFESYRSLGQHIGKAIFPILNPPAEDGAKQEADVQTICRRIENYWGDAAEKKAQQARPPVWFGALTLAFSLGYAYARGRVMKSIA